MHLETFLAQYPNTLSALIAVGTIGAVACSLYFSQLTLKPKIKSAVQASEIVYPTNKGTYRKNTGKD